MSSRYRMTIIDTETGEIVCFEPGLQIEMDLIEDCVNCIVEKGVGVLRTENHVKADIREGIEEAIHKLKRKVRPK